MIKYHLSQIIPFTVLPIAIFSVQRYSANPIGNTTFWWIIQALILLIFGMAGFSYFQNENKQAILVVKLYLIWIVFSLIRGIFVAEIYWDWKGLVVNAFALLIPIIVYTVSNKEMLQSILSVFVKYGLPLSFIFVLPLPLGVWGWYLFPITLLMLFLPVLKLHWKVILLLFSFIGILGDFGARSHVIKYSVPILFLCLYYFRFIIATAGIIRIAFIVFIIAPWIFLALGVSGIFNVFKISDYVQIEYVAESKNDEGDVQKQAITNDSRTFMYVETLQSAIKHNYWLIGRTPARGNDTVVFASKMEEITGRKERLRNEAGIPNIFTYTGIIGVILYFFVFYKASSIAINRSNNIFIKLIGLYVAFRWLYSWVEDNGAFNINTFTLWLMIGVCFSESFRKMNNAEIRLWARGIFDTRYIKYINYIETSALKRKPKLY